MRVFAVVLWTVLALAGAAVLAQAQISTTLKIVAPVPPGGAGDILARMLAEQVGRVQGRTLVIENRPGAGTIIGTEAVARATADGRTCN